MLMRLLLSGILMLGLCAVTPAALAHTMPVEETYISMISADGNTYGHIGRGSTLGDVAEFFGDPSDVKEFRGDGIRNVTYIYDESFEFRGREGQRNTTPAKDLKISSYTIKSSAVCTPSGFAVGAPYERIAEKYGQGFKRATKNGMTNYFYDFNGGAIELCFTVDAAGAVQVMELRTEV